MYEMSWWNQATLHRDRCRQEHAQTHCICICCQRCDQHDEKIQQHRKRSIRHTIWHQETSPLLLSKIGEYHYRSEVTSCNIKKKSTAPSQRLQWSLLKIHQYRVRIIHKSRPDIFIVDWLSREKTQGKERHRNTWHTDK